MAYVDDVHRFATVVLVDPQGRLLLQERDEHAPIDPETWSLSGGHVEEGETFEDAAYRELAEETGIELAPGTLELWQEIQVFHEVYGSLDTVRVYVAATTLTDADVVLGEGRQIVFVAPDVARTLPLSATGSRMVPALLDSDLYRRLIT